MNSSFRAVTLAARHPLITWFSSRATFGIFAAALGGCAAYDANTPDGASGSGAGAGAGATTGGAAGTSNLDSGGAGAASGGAGAGSGGFTAGSGGANAGSGGVSGGAAGAGTGGTTGGAGGNGGAGVDLDTPPWRALEVMPSRSKESFQFYPEDANPAAKRVYQVPQTAIFRQAVNGKPVTAKAKMVVTLHGVGNSAGPGGAANWIANQGFHVLEVDYHNNVSVSQSADPLNAYREIVDGTDRVDFLEVVPANSVLQRVKDALGYLAKQDPGADWGYYLNQDGSVRWSDFIFFGYSMGSQTSIMVSKVVRLRGVVAVSGPNFSKIVNMGSAADKAALADPGSTPVERNFAIVGSADGNTPGIYPSLDLLAWVGMLSAPKALPPYDGSHRILLDGGGHVEFCGMADAGGFFEKACRHAFGIPQ